jgi:hypothetical protein
MGLVVGAGAFAQHSEGYKKMEFSPMKPKVLEDNSVEAKVRQVNPNQHSNVSRGATVWSEDFANGASGNNTSIPSTWTTGSMPIPTLWAWDNTKPPVPTAYTTFYNSETPGNGWMLFNPYTNWITNHSNPYDYTVSTYGELTSPEINLSTTPQVRLEFNNEFYHCCNFEFELVVQVSTDNFTTKTDYIFENTTSTPRNQYNIDVSDPHISLDISSAITGNPATTKIRFVWDGTAADANNQKAVIYWWMIDDVKIVELDAYDLKGGKIITTAANGDPMYTNIPDRVAFPIDIEVEVVNFGSANVNDVNIDGKVDGATAGNVFTGSAAAFNLAYQTKDTVILTTQWTPTTPHETYTMSAVVSSDSTDVYDVSDNNDCDTVFVNVTDTVWGRDDGVFGGRQDPEHNGTLNREYALGNMFEFHQAAIVSSISFWLSVWSGADNSPLAKVVLWQFAGGTDPSNWVEVHASDDFEIDTAMINGTWVTIPFEAPIAIAQGEEFAAMIYHYSQIDTVWTAYSDVDDRNQGRLWTWDDDPAPGQFTMYSTTTAPLVRLNIAPADVNIESLPELTAFSASPNPFSDQVQLRFSLPASKDVDVSIIDITGKTVLSESYGSLPAGVNRIDIDTQRLGSGVYFVNATTGTELKTTKLVKVQ